MQSKSMASSRAIEFARYASSDPAPLCPRCGSTYLHQGRVTIFDRGEDGEQTAVTTVDCGLAATHLMPSGEIANPSSRRHGLAIAFDCESCSDGIELTIAQHKGCTEFKWRFEAWAAEIEREAT